MKSELQINHLLRNHFFKAEIDRTMFLGFCDQLKFKVDYPTRTDNLIELSISEFNQWFEGGYGVGDVVNWNGGLAIVCKHIKTELEITAHWNGEEFNFERVAVSSQEVSHISPEQSKEYHHKLSLISRQFDKNSGVIIEKYIPKATERVEISCDDENILGIVRSINLQDNHIEFYCYWNLTTGQVGFSMHEKDICTIHGPIFSPMSSYGYRKFNRKLQDYGMIWNDKLHRIQPTEYKQEADKRYYYIDDKLQVVKAKEVINGTSSRRYYVGNYFDNPKEAEKYAKILKTVLTDRLAIPKMSIEGI